MKYSRLSLTCTAALFLLTLFPACTSANRMLKAKAAPMSPFMQPAQTPIVDPSNTAWQYTASSNDRKLLLRNAKNRLLYIAPVETAYLRPPSKALARGELNLRGGRRPREEVAMTLRNEFIKAFMHSPAPRYRIVSKPQQGALELRLNLLELDPTSVGGNVGKKLAGLAIGPASALIGIFTSGAIAIEGKLQEPKTRRTLFQFADKEKDKANFISVRDFQPYGHSYRAIREWADQFERYTRQDGRGVGDTSFFTLNPF